MSDKKQVLIAGAGLAGLSTAFHLKDREYRIIEKNDRPGGLCRTERIKRHTFDYGGHLLHIRCQNVKDLVTELLGDNLALHKRVSSILSNSALTPYPFQANLHGLPAEVVRDCLVGFVEAMLWAERDSQEPENFLDWIHSTFGKGFAEHFFLPFNLKFFKTPLHEITPDWTGWAVPRPSLKEVVDGALGIQERDFGYNVEFLYPRSGGIEELPRALASRLARPVETGVELVEVAPENKRAVLSTGEEVTYSALVSTVPLDHLLAMMRGGPEEIAGAAENLRVLSVLCVNLGIAGPPVSDRHWIYVPGPEYSFHRIGVYSNMAGPEPLESPENPGKTRSTLYLEITLPGPVEDPEGLAAAAEKALAEFRNTPFWKQGDHEIEVVKPALIKHGYVVYDLFRKKALPRIFQYLKSHGIEPLGRYGRWEYSTMEDAIRQGREAAEALAEGS